MLEAIRQFVASGDQLQRVAAGTGVFALSFMLECLVTTYLSPNPHNWFTWVSGLVIGLGLIAGVVTTGWAIDPWLQDIRLSIGVLIGAEWLIAFLTLATSLMWGWMRLEAHGLGSLFSVATIKGFKLNDLLATACFYVSAVLFCALLLEAVTG